MPRPCSAAKGLECVFPIFFTQCGCVWFTHAMPMLSSDHAVLLKAMAQHVCREMACGLPARFWLLPATTWSSTKIVFGRIPISDAGGHCETKHRFSWTRKRVVAAHYKKDCLLHCWTSSSVMSGWINSGHGMGTACYVWIGLKCVCSPADTVVHPECVWNPLNFVPGETWISFPLVKWQESGIKQPVPKDGTHSLPLHTLHVLWHVNGSKE